VHGDSVGGCGKASHLTHRFHQRLAVVRARPADQSSIDIEEDERHPFQNTAF
jgi:hypothetical protein